MLAPPPPSASRLLRVEHAVAEALLDAGSADDAFPRLLAAVGEGLGWHYGGVWLPVASGALHCVATWSAGASRWSASPRPRARSRWGRAKACPAACRRAGGRPGSPTSRADPNFPRGAEPRGRAARRVRDPARPAPAARSSSSPPSAQARRGPDRDARQPRPPGRPVRRAPPRRGRRARERGAQAGDARRRARRRDDDRRRRAIVEVNAAVQDVFGYLPETLIGSEMATGSCRRAARAHRAGCARPAGALIGRRIEITAMHSDGTRVPGRADDHPHRRPRPADVHRLRPRHHRPRPARAGAARVARPDRRRRRRGPPPPRARPPRRRPEPPARRRPRPQ